MRIRQAINEGKLRSRLASPTMMTEFPYEKILSAQGLLGPAQTGAVLPSALAAMGLAVLPMPPTQQPQIEVLLGMPGDNHYPFTGYINFSNNQLNPNTGSIAIRGLFDNPAPPNGVRLMSPGMFVRIRLPIGAPHPALLVIDRAIQSDQGQKYVYVVDASSKVEYRPVTTGALEDNGLRVITSGLKADDLVVVGAIQQVRANMQVTTQAATMPSFGPITRP
jgi:multidrug efflux system membrane fusion protein